MRDISDDIASLSSNELSCFQIYEVYFCNIQKLSRNFHQYLSSYEWIPFLQGFALAGCLKTAKCECLWSSTRCQVRMFVKQG